MEKHHILDFHTIWGGKRKSDPNLSVKIHQRETEICSLCVFQMYKRQWGNTWKQCWIIAYISHYNVSYIQSSIMVHMHMIVLICEFKVFLSTQCAFNLESCSVVPADAMIIILFNYSFLFVCVLNVTKLEIDLIDVVPSSTIPTSTINCGKYKAINWTLKVVFNACCSYKWISPLGNKLSTFSLEWMEPFG